MEFQHFAVAFLLVLATVLPAGAFADELPSTYSLNLTILNQNPDPARAGEVMELRFMVENEGGTEARDIRYELIPKYPFVAIPGESYTRTISTLSAYQRGEDAAIIKFEVMVDSDAVKGTNEIALKRTFAGSDIVSTRTFKIEVTGTEFAQIIYVDKAKLYPGNETPLKFTITNVGNSPLRDLVFSWSEEDGVILPVYSDDTKYIKSIGVGESVELEYTVVADVNAVQGLYQLDLSLQYETESGVTEEMSTKAGIFVGGETDFDVTFSESSEGVTSLSVANVGNNPAYSVTVRIPMQEGYTISGSTSTIVGNLDKGDYTIVSFQISQSTVSGFAALNFSRMTPEERAAQREAISGAGGAGSDLLVQIDYTDTTGERHVIEKEVPIQFRDIDTTSTTATDTRFTRTSVSPIALYVTYALFAAVLIAAMACYWKRDRVREKVKLLLGKLSKRKGG
jgi:hypothetical protein